MFELKTTLGVTKSILYSELSAQVSGLLVNERDWLANTANISAFLYQGIPGLNWVGFYFLRSSELVLGPFQGKVACVRISLGRGVCGTAALRRETIVVPDVSQFPGHIACDHNSKSEIVIPLVKEGILIGVLDLDSPLISNFDQVDAEGLGQIMKLLIAGTDFSGLI
jgi:GAF domain-containing protein